LTTILWNLDTDDWAAGTSETLEKVTKTYEDYVTMGQNGTFKNSGQIVLTHEIDNTTMTLAMEFLPKIQAAYKNVLDVATCMNITNPYQESTVTFAPFGAAAVSNTTTSPAVSAAGVSSAAAPAAASASSSTTVSAVAGSKAATSAGIQVNPNSLVVAAFVAAAYFF
jgi:hypothetical protein